jgi:NAD-dependent dihydropyrimidine dehydrogenase PreA subunit
MLEALKTIIQTIFRLFPFPTRTGLRTVGQPGPDAPVFVTCNFDLTVRRVTRALQGLNCYLLVAQSKGINVWCAASGGMFNAHSVISAVKTSRIAEKVSHHTLILPQLSAPGIDVARMEQETGWRCKFGPVYARDIPAYVAAHFRKTADMRQAAFPLADRLQMVVMWAGMLSLLAGIPVAVLGLATLPDGTGPLYAGSTVAYWGRKWPGIYRLWSAIGYELEPFFTLQVDTARCNGCKTCVEVCPKGVYELYRIDGKQKSRVARLANCEQCTACVKQCPERAILADPPIRVFGEI